MHDDAYERFGDPETGADYNDGYTFEDPTAELPDGFLPEQVSPGYTPAAEDIQRVPCGCLIVSVGEGVVQLCPECEEALVRYWTRADEDRQEFGQDSGCDGDPVDRFDDVVYGALLADIEQLAPLQLLVTDLFEVSADREADDLRKDRAFWTLQRLIERQTDEVAFRAWFPWLAEQADARADDRLAWPLMLSRAEACNEAWDAVRPDGLELTDNIDADAHAFLMRVFGRGSE